MRFYELKPTDETLIQLMLEDSIKRNGDLVEFADMLAEIDGHASIALDSAWGSGKTFFVKQLKILFDAFNASSNPIIGEHREEIRDIWRKRHTNNETLKQHHVVYYDCWENDSDCDPILSLVYSITQTEVTDFNLSASSPSLDEATKLFNKLLGGKAAIAFDAMKVAGRAINKEEIVESINAEKNIKRIVSGFLDSLFEKYYDRMIIIVDELDRCNPDYAVKVLERIKHYFADERITFVFATNLSELQHTIRKHYGTEFNAVRYLDRFFDLQLELESVDMDVYCSTLDFNKEDTGYMSICKSAAKAYKLTMRESCRLYTAANRAKEAILKELNGEAGYVRIAERQHLAAEIFAVNCLAPIILALKISGDPSYEPFIQGKDRKPLENISKYLDRGMRDTLGYMGGSISNSPVAVLDSLYRAIFSEYLDEESKRNVGELTFTKQSANELKRCVFGFIDKERIVLA